MTLNLKGITVFRTVYEAVFLLERDLQKLQKFPVMQKRALPLKGQEFGLPPASPLVVLLLNGFCFCFTKPL